MLAYAAQKPRPAGRAGSPKALILIVAGHAALIAAMMAAKMDVIHVTPFDPTKLIDISAPPPPPQPDPETKPEPKPQDPSFRTHQSTTRKQSSTWARRRPSSSIAGRRSGI